MPDQIEFLLEVPIDASQVSDFKPDHPVKVVAYTKQGEAQERVVTLDADARGVASFRFPQAPGSVKVALGPESANGADLQNLQTISLDVPASSWRDTNAVKLPAVAISSYYWRWWLRWCRSFKVTGRLLCANGNPVPGATVTAYDVDYWWWWTSQELVGTAVTDINGAFEIDFTRCCGWWPWYWWDLRYWQVDPYLVERISAVVKQDPKLGRLPAAIPAPSLDVFQSLLASSAKTTRAGLLANVPRPATSLVNSTSVDPEALNSLRERLIDVLPREFPFPIWPWYPWFPWLDCGANLIFKATQVCSGQTNTVLSQTIADVNWDIPDNFTVTLNANDLACCVYTCDDQCPEGNCVIPNGICSEPNVDSIGGNVSAPPCTPAQVGLYAPGVQDRPFAGSVVLYGILGTAFNADYYEFQYATAQAGPYTPLPLAAVAGFDRYALKILPGPTFVPITVPFPVTQIPDSSATLHNVYETIAHYMAVNGNPGWTSDPNELMVLNSDVLVNGTYYLRMVAYVLTGPDQIALADTGNPGSPGVVPICDPNTGDPVVNNWWVLTLDNQAPLPTDPSGQPCGLHICTNQPTSDILQVAIVNPVTGTTTVISGCDNVCINPTDLLQIDFVAYDPDAFLDYYDLQLLYGFDQSVALLCNAPFPTCNPAFSTWSLAPSPAAIAPPWAPPAAQVGPSYSDALGQGATSPVWAGGSIRLTVNASSGFPQTCAYLLQLNVYKRTIVDCDGDDPQQNVSFESFTVQVFCPPAGS